MTAYQLKQDARAISKDSFELRYAVLYPHELTQAERNEIDACIDDAIGQLQNAKENLANAAQVRALKEIANACTRTHQDAPGSL